MSSPAGADLIRAATVAGAVWLAAFTIWLLLRRPPIAPRPRGTIHPASVVSYLIILAVLIYGRIKTYGSEVDWRSVAFLIAIILGIYGVARNYHLGIRVRWSWHRKRDRDNQSSGPSQ